jgi:AcrR family transcriptional regulator
VTEPARRRPSATSRVRARPGRRSNAVIARDGATKDRVLRSATVLFARNGYHATGMAEIADSLALGRGALYHHIQSKQNLLLEISVSPLEELIGLASGIASLDISAEAKLRRIARAHLAHLAAHRAMWTVSLYESRALAGTDRDQLQTLRNDYQAIWAAVLQECARESVTAEVTPLQTRGILSLFNSTYRWLDRDGLVPTDQVADIYVDLVLDGLRRRA